MIEFKGQCGHIIRARDEDAGKVVRCPYCGRDAAVAAPAGDEAGALLDAVERTGHFDAVATRQGQKQARTNQKRKAATGENGDKRPANAPLDPFAVTMKMIYVAAIVIVVAVAWKYGSMAVNKLKNAPLITGGTPKPSTVPVSGPSATTAPSDSKFGLLSERLNPDQEGVYVSSVPAGAMVFSVPRAGGDASMVEDASADRNMETNHPLRLTPGRHSVAIAVRVNHPALMELPGYAEVRRKIESDEFDSRLLLNSFFVPDRATDSRVMRVRGLRHIVRAYEVDVPARTWMPVTALFLPREKLTAILPHLSRTAAYGFDEPQVRSELGFYGVPPAEQADVLDALRRLGKVSYQTEADGPYRLFQINLRDGALISEESSR
jgi:hypothetical protein